MILNNLMPISLLCKNNEVSSLKINFNGTSIEKSIDASNNLDMNNILDSLVEKSPNSITCIRTYFTNEIELNMNVSNLHDLYTITSGHDFYHTLRQYVIIV